MLYKGDVVLSTMLSLGVSFKFQKDLVEICMVSLSTVLEQLILARQFSVTIVILFFLITAPSSMVKKCLMPRRIMQMNSVLTSDRKKLSRLSSRIGFIFIFALIIFLFLFVSFEILQRKNSCLRSLMMCCQMQGSQILTMPRPRPLMLRHPLIYKQYDDPI